MKKMAANRAARPVMGVAGPKVTAAFPLEELLPAVEVDEVPPLVAEGLVSGLALLVRQVLTPLITPAEAAELKRSQMVVLVEVVWTLDPPRTSVSLFMVTLGKRSVSTNVIKWWLVRSYLLKVPAKSRAPTIVANLGRPLIALRLVLFATKKPPPMVSRDGKAKLVKLGLSTKAKVPPVAVRLGAEKLWKVSE